MQTKLKTQQEEYKETELGVLPKEWEVVKLGDCLELLRNGTTRKQNTKGEGFPVSRIETISESVINPQKVRYIKELTEEEIEKYKLIMGDILFSHINSEPYLGNSAIYHGEPEILIHGMNLLLFRTKKEILNSEFLNYLFNHFRKIGIFIGIASRAVNQSSINQGKIKALEIPLPPLPEQKSIAFVLSTIQTAKEKTERVIQATKELKKSMMKHLFTYGPVSLEEAEKVKLKETEIGKMPEEWEVVELNKVLEDASKERRFIIDDSKEYKQITVKLYSKGLCLRNLSKGSKIGVKKQYVIKSGDFVFSKIDARNGAYGFVPDYLDGGIVSGDFPILVLKRKTCDEKFLSYYLSLDKNWVYLRGFAVGTTNRKRLQPKEFLRYIKIPLPPLPTQQKIASILSAIDEKIQAEENKKKALEELFKSMLHNLMTAKIRVKIFKLAEVN